jgi:hypothetical protein
MGLGEGGSLGIEGKFLGRFLLVFYKNFFDQRLQELGDVQPDASRVERRSVRGFKSRETVN